MPDCHQIFRWQLSKQVRRRIGLSRIMGRKTWPLSQVDFWEQGVKPQERDIHKMIIALALGSFSKTLGCWRHLRCDLSLYALQLPSASHWQCCWHHSYSRLIQFTQNSLWCQPAFIISWAQQAGLWSEAVGMRAAVGFASAAVERHKCWQQQCQ